MILNCRKVHLREQKVSEEEANMKLYFFCDICGKSYTNKSGLKTHKLHVHEKYSEEVPCDVCGISFRTRELLKQHQEREHSECPRFACDTCGMRFGNNYHLKRHEVIHSDEELPCPLCSRRFKRKDGLDTHMSHIHGVSNQDYASQLLENNFTKTSLQDSLQDSQSDIGEEDTEEKSFTELISYDSLYTQNMAAGPFLTSTTIDVEQFEQSDYFPADTVELKTKSINIMSQLETLSQYKPTSTLVQPVTADFSLDNLPSGESYESLSPCVPVLEPHMSTPILRSDQLETMEQLYDHEILNTDSPDLSVRQSVIRIKKNISIK